MEFFGKRLFRTYRISVFEEHLYKIVEVGKEDMTNPRIGGWFLAKWLEERLGFGIHTLEMRRNRMDGGGIKHGSSSDCKGHAWQVDATGRVWPNGMPITRRLHRSQSELCEY